MKKQKHLNQKEITYLNMSLKMYELDNLNHTHESYLQVLKKDIDKENNFEEYFDILKRDILMVIRLHTSGSFSYNELNQRLVLLIAFQLMAEELEKTIKSNGSTE